MKAGPDNVDFRSCNDINIYSERNMFYNKDSTFKLSGTVEGRGQGWSI
jgi:hypothetical protein